MFSFSPLLVGVLSETIWDIADALGRPQAFSPLLVGVLSETCSPHCLTLGNRSFSPLLVGVLS